MKNCQVANLFDSQTHEVTKKIGSVIVGDQKRLTGLWASG